MAAKNGRTTIKIDPEVLKAAKRDAEELGITLSAFIERTLRQGGFKGREPREPLDLPTVSGTGPPRIELTPETIKDLLHEGEIESYLESLPDNDAEAA